MFSSQSNKQFLLSFILLTSLVTSHQAHADGTRKMKAHENHNNHDYNQSAQTEEPLLYGCKNKLCEVNRPTENLDNSYKITFPQLVQGGNRFYISSSSYKDRVCRRFGFDIYVEHSIKPGGYDYNDLADIQTSEGTYNIISNSYYNYQVIAEISCAYSETYSPVGIDSNGTIYRSK